MKKLFGRWAMLASGMLLSASVLAQTGPIELDIPTQPLSQALNALARQSGAQIVFVTDVTAGKTAPAIKGRLTVSEALTRLLQGTGLHVQADDERTFAIVRSPSSAQVEQTLPAVNVTAEPERSDLPQAYAGGQVARGARLGTLGNRGVMDTPFNITGYTQQTIQDQQARSVADVVQNDPSVRMVSPQTNGSEVFTIRGFPVSNQDIAFDGLFGILPYWRGSVASAERVEVLKGPSALLNGMAPSGGVGGAINIVPKRAGDTPLAQLTTTYISDSNFGTQFDIGRRFGPDNSVGLRVNGVYRDGDTNRTAQDHKEATVALDYRGRNVRLWADGGYQRLDLDKVEGLTSLAAGVQPPSPPDADKSYFQSWTHWKNYTTYGVLRGEADLNDDWTAYAALGSRRYRDDYLFPFGFGLDAQGNFTEGFANAASKYNSTSAETGLRGRFATGAVKHQLSLAVSRLRQNADVSSRAAGTHASNIYQPTAISEDSIVSALGAPVRTITKTTLSSVALADTLSFMEDKVQLTLGARQQQVKIDSSTPANDYDKDALTPSLALVVKTGQNISLYGNYIEGLSQGPTPPATALNKTDVFAPVKSKQYEAGVKFDFGRIASTVSLFQITRPSGTLNASTNIYSVDGEQRNRGIEWNVFGEVARGVRLLGGVMLLDPEQTHTANGANDGKDATNSPHMQANLGGEWDTPFMAGLTLNARALYTASAYIDAANTQEVPSWTRFDIGARYAFRAGGTPVTLRANIENLFDRTYWMSSSLYRGNPRTFMLSATVDF